MGDGKHIPDIGALRDFLDAAPDAILVVDRGGTIVLANELVVSMFGHPLEDLVGRRVEALLPEAHRAAHRMHREAYSDRPRTRPMGTGQALRGLRSDGTEIAIEISLSSIDVRDARFTIAIVRDITERDLAEARFRALLESAPDAIVVVDVEGRIVIVNGQTESMFGYTRDELIGNRVEILVPERARLDHVETRSDYTHRPRTRPMGSGRELAGRRRDGTEFPVEISLSPLRAREGTLITSIIRDISERRLAERRLAASLREKEVLLQEIHHRVKNNLQVTSSLLKLQATHIRDPRVKEILAESQNRIRSMALVHEKLYQSSDFSRIDLVDYVRSLGKLLVRAIAPREALVDVEVRGDGVYVGIESAVPFGLVVNELLSNCFKHAFPHGRRGKVVATIARSGGGALTIVIEDDGVGIPEGVDPASSETLGLRLVRNLVDQLGGSIRIERSKGTSFVLTFEDVG